MQISDVPGAYVNADMPEDEFILLNIKGVFMDIMCEVSLKHKKIYAYIMV